jgi:hypothetical protein
MLWPAVAGFADDVTAVVDEAAAVLTVSPPVPELDVKLALPAYVAEIVWLPAENPFVVSDADPAASDALPSSVPPSKNWTTPAGDPAPGAATETTTDSVTA